MPIDGAMIYAGISRKLAQAERLGAIRLESRDCGLDQGFRQIPMTKGLTRFLPFGRHLCPHACPRTRLPARQHSHGCHSLTARSRLP